MSYIEDLLKLRYNPAFQFAKEKSSQDILSPQDTSSSSFPTSVGRLFNDLSGTTATQEFNASEAEKTRQHQLNMAQHQYQWAVEDIRKAGLNPALLYASGGNGNTAPSGAMASSGVGSAGEILGAVSGIMNSVNTARMIDLKSGSNEISGLQAYQIYKAVSKILTK